MENKNILLAVCGGIAAYKAADLCSKLVKEKANVKCIFTKNAHKFIGATTFQALTGNTVYTDIFENEIKIPHIELAKWADLIIVAPATANQMAKAAYGFADCLLSATLLAAVCPIIWVPAMNLNMYVNPATKSNVKTLLNHGHFVLEPESGLMACGTTGKGRYPDNKQIVNYIQSILFFKNLNLKGKNVLVTAGASVEEIDPMRYISNNSSGKMGIALATAAYFAGANVCLIHGKLAVDIPYFLTGIKALSAEEMYSKTLENYQNQDYVFMVAAVADYTCQKQSHKIKKDGDLTLKLTKTKDILLELGKQKQNQVLIGFAAESQNLEENANKKLASKNLDFIVANMLKVAGQNTTEAKLISKQNTKILAGSKLEVAHKIIEEIICKKQ